MTGQEFRDYVVRTFKRTDKDDEIYEATTDVIQLLQQSYPLDDFKTLKVDSQISSGNSFTLPSDFSQFVTKISLLDDDSGWSLNHISASEFERKYASFHADTDDDGYPQDYCVINGTVYVGPRPDKYTYNYRYVYEYTLGTDITSSTANVAFTNVNRKMLKHYVLGALYLDLENDLAQHHNQIASGIFNALIGKDEKNTKGSAAVKYNDL